MIFLWLASKGLRDKLTIEECIAVGGKLHQVDCSVSFAENLKVSYLYLTQGVRDRDALFDAMRRRYSHCYFIFHMKTVKPAEGSPGCIIATPTHRSAAHFYDDCSYYHDVREPVLAPGSIHALDPGEANLITYRSLRCRIPPRVFSAQQVVSPLSAVRVSPKTGELVHPDDYEIFQRRKRRRREEQLARRRGHL